MDNNKIFKNLADMDLFIVDKGVTRMDETLIPILGFCVYSNDNNFYYKFNVELSSYEKTYEWLKNSLLNFNPFSWITHQYCIEHELSSWNSKEDYKVKQWDKYNFYSDIANVLKQKCEKIAKDLNIYFNKYTRIKNKTNELNNKIDNIKKQIIEEEKLI